MTQNADRWRTAIQRTTAVCLLASTISGCSFTQSSSSIRSLPEPPVEHLRLLRADTAPLTGTFKQDGHTVVGQLTLGTGCATESTQTVRRQNVTETHTNRATSITWAIVGGVLTAVGTGLLVASESADSRVTCGNNLDSAPKDGDRCSSMSGDESTLGFSTLLTGLAAATAATIFLVRKPQTETTDLPPQQVTHVTTPVACGNVAALSGLVLALDLPGNGKWTGRAASDGSVRIDINDKIPLPIEATVAVTVDSVPPSFATLVMPGAKVGTLTLTDGHADGARSKLTARR
jgi:hypothetical protein